MPILLERMTGAELVDYAATKSVVFFPVGPIEDHGVDLPVATDAIIAEKLAWHLAIGIEKEEPGTRVIIAPRLPFGVDATSKKTNALTVRGYVLRDALLDLALGLRKKGFRFFGVVSGHLGPRQLTAIEEAGKLFKRRTRFSRLIGFRAKDSHRALFSVSSALVPEKEARRHPFSPRYADHAGRIERSKLLSIDPEWVKPADAGAAMQVEGSAGEGKSLYADEVVLLLPKIRAVLSGSDANGLFRSWYSLFPINSSFFLGWLLVAALLTLIVGWAMIVIAAFT